jgi:hypothetical protein
VNRGNWLEWDTSSRIKARVKSLVICDREKDSLKECLSDYLNRKELTFEAIIDFSGYKSNVIKSVIADIPAFMIKLYIYISTDSVYEVCINKKFDDGVNGFVLTEEDAIRPRSKEDRARLKKFDSYGHHKLK